MGLEEVSHRRDDLFPGILENEVTGVFEDPDFCIGKMPAPLREERVVEDEVASPPVDARWCISEESEFLFDFTDDLAELELAEAS